MRTLESLTFPTRCRNGTLSAVLESMMSPAVITCRFVLVQPYAAGLSLECQLGPENLIYYSQATPSEFAAAMSPLPAVTAWMVLVPLVLLALLLIIVIIFCCCRRRGDKDTYSVDNIERGINEALRCSPILVNVTTALFRATSIVNETTALFRATTPSLHPLRTKRITNSCCNFQKLIISNYLFILLYLIFYYIVLYI